MIHHLVLLTTKPEVIPTKLEEIMVETRIRLLKIGEVNNLRVGKRVDTENNPNTYFFSFDVENMDKLAFVMENAVYVQFEKQILGPFVATSKSLDYEMEPARTSGILEEWPNLSAVFSTFFRYSCFWLSSPEWRGALVANWPRNPQEVDASSFAACKYSCWCFLSWRSSFWCRRYSDIGLDKDGISTILGHAA